VAGVPRDCGLPVDRGGPRRACGGEVRRARSSRLRDGQTKELRVGTIRILFAFDPRRAAILLIGGNKRGRWQEFYATAIPLADDLFDEHLAAIENQGDT